MVLQSFECERSTVKAAQKQEWAFTLYDFDGQGKVTKEVGPVSNSLSAVDICINNWDLDQSLLMNNTGMFL